jgi:hypothetical protein
MHHQVVHACIEPTQTPDRLLAELEWLCGPERSFFRGNYGAPQGLKGTDYDFGEVRYYLRNGGVSINHFSVIIVWYNGRLEY